MIYYVFDTEAEAITAENTVVTNIKTWVQTYSPDAIGPDGNSLKGRNAKTNELVNNYTTTWAIPAQRLDGKWVFQKPTQPALGPIPLVSVINGITATEAEYDESWFPDPEENFGFQGPEQQTTTNSLKGAFKWPFRKK